MPKRAVPVALILGLAPALAFGQIRVGSEFQVNAYTTGNQQGKAVASDASGNFIVVWHSVGGQDGAGAGVFARRFLASGAPVEPTEFVVNAHTTGYQANASVASDATGRLVVVWESDGQDGDEMGVFGRRYDAAGTPGLEFSVNEYSTNAQRAAAVALDANGNFVVVWESDGQDGDAGGVFARRYDADGVAQGSEFAVNAQTNLAQGSPSVAMDAAGNFVVVWTSAGQDGDGDGIFGQRYDAAGVPEGVEFGVNSYTTGQQTAPSVAMDAEGDFVVAWDSETQDGDAGGVFGQRFDAAGVAQGGEFPMNEYTTARQALTAVTMDRNGNFVVGWSSALQDGDNFGSFVRAFDASGAPQGGDFMVNSFTAGLQYYATPAYGPGGRFVVAWMSPGDGEGYGMFAGLFATDLIFRDGLE